MIAVYTKPDHSEERRYILDLFFGEFLGVPFQIRPADAQDPDEYRVVLDNGSELKVEDHFFAKIGTKGTYLCPDNVPGVIKFGKNRFIPEPDIPVIYGSDKVVIERGGRSVRCGIDIFAGAFFMLSRWEECVSGERDGHGRFPASASTAFRNNFLQRPVVNEYLEMLWNMLVFLGFAEKRAALKFEMILQHDIDRLYRFAGPRDFIMQFGGDIFKRLDLMAALADIGTLFSNPFDTFNLLMDISDKLGVKSRLFFMTGGNPPYGGRYRIDCALIKRALAKIGKRGHLLGLHPSYDSFNDPAVLRMEKEVLEGVSGQRVSVSRQHFLRFEVPSTWKICDEAGIEYDCTMGYPEREGFRCGTCLPFPVFDIKNRKRLKIREESLILSDTAIAYQSDPPGESEERISGLIKKVKRYGGHCVFLWHNSSFYGKEWMGYKEIYSRVLLGV